MAVRTESRRLAGICAMLGQWTVRAACAGAPERRCALN